MDTVPRHGKIKDAFERKGITFSDHITCSSTVPTLITMFSGKTPTEMFGIGGVGHSHSYGRFVEDKEKWNEEMIFHNFTKSPQNITGLNWTTHIHSMPLTRGDGGKGDYGSTSFKLLPDDICGRTDNMKFYEYNVGGDESNFIKKMQDMTGNHFIVLKFNHYHDSSRGTKLNYNGKSMESNPENIVDMYVDMIDNMDFDEPESLFWIYADHGEPHNVGLMMPPPDSWLAWCGIKDNITNKKIDKKIIGCDDFKNTVLNRIYNKNLPNDILEDVDMNRIYVREDGRSAVNPNFASTVSAIKALDENRYIQYVCHSPQAANKRHFHNIMERTIIYNKTENTIDAPNVIESEIGEQLKQHLIDGPWEWYFRETAKEKAHGRENTWLEKH
jgi:hypothetical protein